MAVDARDAARKRAEARGGWAVRRFRMGEEPGDDLSGSTTAEERLAMLDTLAQEAWALTGRPVPAYRRGEAPVRIVALGSLD